MSETEKIASYRFLHANNRLRTRYGIEMDFDEYTEMCRAFQTDSPKIRGLRKNHVGDKEGWIELRGTWVCAHYKVGQRLIATFMPAPPPLDTGPAPQPVLASCNEKLAAENTRLRKRLEELNKSQNAMVNERAKKQVEDMLKARETVQGNSKRDLKWAMGQITRIEALLMDGEVNEAKDRLQALVRFSAGANPGQMADREAEYEAQVKAAMDARAYWTKKFDPNHPETMLEDPCPKIPAA